MILASDFMKIAATEALQAKECGDVPVGAVITLNGEIISQAHNQVIANNDALAHAEILAIQTASKFLGERLLTDCDMYITLEPCSMCAGAIVLARIKRVFIGADDTKTGAAGSIYNILQDKRLNHYCEVYYGIAKDKCSKLLTDFFDELRASKKIKYDTI